MVRHSVRRGIQHPSRAAKRQQPRDKMDRDFKNGIIRVGDGRGFLVASVRWAEPLVITAAHCLPHLPPPHTLSRAEERTYLQILGPLSKNAPTIAAECLFVDPVADVAVLAAPDSQAFSREYEKYDALTVERPTFRVTTPQYLVNVSLLNVRGEWERCQVPAVAVPFTRHLSLIGNEAAYAPETSGSPILTDDWSAIGIVCCGNHGNPALALCLPMWLLREMVAL